MDDPELVLSWLETTRSCINEAAAALTSAPVDPQAAGFALVRAIDTLDEAFNTWCTPEPARRKPAPVIDLAEQRQIRRSGAGGPIGAVHDRRIPPHSPGHAS